MIRLSLLCLIAAVALTGCAALMQRTAGVAEPAMAPTMMEALPLCQPGDDGIGGTGCPVH